MTDSFSFSKRSEQRLRGVHPHLRKLAQVAIAQTTLDFTVLEGARSPARQKELVEAGASWTMMSRHLKSWVPASRHNVPEFAVPAGMYAHAIDIAPMISGSVRWDWPLFHKLYYWFEFSARYIEEKHGFRIPFDWGGDWRPKEKRDGPHFQLPFGLYPYLEKP